MIKVWIARDMSGDVYAYRRKPVKNNGRWDIEDDVIPKEYEVEYLGKSMFPLIKKEDKEPTLVSLNEMMELM